LRLILPHQQHVRTRAVACKVCSGRSWRRSRDASASQFAHDERKQLIRRRAVALAQAVEEARDV